MILGIMNYILKNYFRHLGTGLNWLKSQFKPVPKWLGEQTVKHESKKK